MNAKVVSCLKWNESLTINRQHKLEFGRAWTSGGTFAAMIAKNMRSSFTREFDQLFFGIHLFYKTITEIKNQYQWYSEKFTNQKFHYLQSLGYLEPQLRITAKDLGSICCIMNCRIIHHKDIRYLIEGYT